MNGHEEARYVEREPRGFDGAKLIRIGVRVLAGIGACALVLLIMVFVAVSTADPVRVGDRKPPRAPSSGLRADTLSAEITVPFDQAAARLNSDVKLSDAGGGRLRVKTPVHIFGRELMATSDGDLSVDGSDIVVRPQTVSVEGLPLLDSALGAMVRQAAGVRTPLPGLPEGMTIKSVTSTPAGLRVRVEGTGVQLPGR